MTNLYSVDNPNADTDAHAINNLPLFEGEPVHFSRVKLTSTSNLECDEAMKMDDIGRFYVEGRVVGVSHIVDEKTGKVARVHTIKVTEALRLPWDFDVENLFRN